VPLWLFYCPTPQELKQRDLRGTNALNLRIVSANAVIQPGIADLSSWLLVSSGGLVIVVEDRICKQVNLTISLW